MCTLFDCTELSLGENLAGQKAVTASNTGVVERVQAVVDLDYGKYRLSSCYTNNTNNIHILMIHLVHW